MKHSLKPVELFLALGLAVTVGACGGPSVDSGEGGEATDEQEAITQPATEEGGEGGEGGEGEEGEEGDEGGEGGEGEESDEGGEGGEGGEGDED